MQKMTEEIKWPAIEKDDLLGKSLEDLEKNSNPEMIMIGRKISEITKGKLDLRWVIAQAYEFSFFKVFKGNSIIGVAAVIPLEQEKNIYKLRLIIDDRQISMEEIAISIKEIYEELLKYDTEISILTIKTTKDITKKAAIIAGFKDLSGNNGNSSGSQDKFFTLHFFIKDYRKAQQKNKEQLVLPANRRPDTRRIRTFRKKEETQKIILRCLLDNSDKIKQSKLRRLTGIGVMTIRSMVLEFEDKHLLTRKKVFGNSYTIFPDIEKIREKLQILEQ